ncbi:AMMECR1-like protein [Glarea lozoyensis ATCC 20868]|uniref:AMMECR1-like protein n=1 Tax=Glarea lozoyensis (strain ATCC 20868 / MF5171) TaxID=1116229 RepID=S3DDR3_GLAL2|nr:AMMECR1-like protein [Glarea lozoyensis ATCC 20868]EPE35875.1 AMMECR1-like protein [Glarea lozoyensis ATCC 20868]
MATVEHCLYCFEALSASLEKRSPMSLYQVQTSWDSYPKGLDEDDSEVETSSAAEPGDSEPVSRPTPRHPSVQRIADNRNSSRSSGSSTPASSSSNSLSVESAASTPGSSGSYSPVGLHPRRTSQRGGEITESPLFVTWNTIEPSSQHPRSLRGCIGTFESLPIASGLASYALTSALQDHRFSPISLRELPTLEVSVTLLTDFEPCKDAMDWELGIHGLRISFYARNKRYGACYLPDVAVEQGWDKEETIVSLMRKAGWSGKKEKWTEVGDLKCVRFQGKAESAGWDEYKNWKEWVEKGGEGKN